VHIQSDAYIVFEGDVFDPSDSENASFEADTNSLHSYTGDVVFSQLTGTTSAPIVITLTGSGRSSDITISRSGRISWTQ
jgi:hypothetical protein